MTLRFAFASIADQIEHDGLKLLNSRPVNDPDRQKPGTIDLIAPQAQRWRDAAMALMSDPEAPLPGVED
jgi:hypothetical protein